MPACSFPELSVFVAVARRRSFRRAAVDLGVSPSAVSHALRQLEDRLSLKLVNRTTRSVALTEAGQRLFDRVGPAFDGIDSAVDELNAFREAPQGLLRINAPRQAVRLALGGLIAEFVRLNPRMRVFVAGRDQLDDVVAEGFDAGVRLGELVAADMIAVPVGPPLGFRLVASPAYLDGRAHPDEPHDLQDHALVAYRFPSGKPFRWTFRREGRAVEFDAEATLAFDDMDLVLDAALSDAGVAYVFEGQARSHLASGRLVELLADWRPAPAQFFLYYPSRSNLSFGLRAFIDLARRSGRVIDEQGSSPQAGLTV